jgi:hypothetical protein
MLSMSNMVADEKAEKQTGNNRDVMFKQSLWSDQKKPNLKRCYKIEIGHRTNSKIHTETANKMVCSSYKNAM